MFKKKQTMYSDDDNHFKFTSQHSWGDLYDHLMSTKILTSIMNKIFVVLVESGYGLHLDLTMHLILPPSHNNIVICLIWLF